MTYFPDQVRHVRVLVSCQRLKMRFLILIRYPDGRAQWDIQLPSFCYDWGDAQWLVRELRKQFPGLQFSYIGICI